MRRSLLFLFPLPWRLGVLIGVLCGTPASALESPMRQKQKNWQYLVQSNTPGSAWTATTVTEYPVLPAHLAAAVLDSHAVPTNHGGLAGQTRKKKTEASRDTASIGCTVPTALCRPRVRWERPVPVSPECDVAAVGELNTHNDHSMTIMGVSLRRLSLYLRLVP